MNDLLLSRALGSVSPSSLARVHNDRLVHSIQAADHVKLTSRYDTGPETIQDDGGEESSRRQSHVAHTAGVNSLVIDRFDGRYLLSGGADASIAVWDLDAARVQNGYQIHQPLGHVKKEVRSHASGITQLSFYPFDSLAFLSSSYDHNVRLYSSETLAESASFDLDSVVYSHSISVVATHLLVACATQHPAVRLLDLRSGASTHALAGHGGSVLSVAWHPKSEHLLVSGGTDGAVRLWDIRRSASSLGLLNMDDGIGTPGLTGAGVKHARRERARAHNGLVNGLVWTDDGDFLVSNGHDENVRVWNAATGANTLVNFGPSIKNSHASALQPLITPTHLTGKSRELLVYPNPREILIHELHTGRLWSRLLSPSHTASHSRVAAGAGTRNVRNRTTSLAWRPHHVEMYSAHADGTIRCWQPRTWEDATADDEIAEEENDGEDEGAVDRKRKREELDDLVASLTKKKVTWI